MSTEEQKKQQILPLSEKIRYTFVLSSQDLIDALEGVALATRKFSAAWEELNKRLSLDDTKASLPYGDSREGFERWLEREDDKKEAP